MSHAQVSIRFLSSPLVKKFVERGLAVAESLPVVVRLEDLDEAIAYQLDFGFRERSFLVGCRRFARFCGGARRVVICFDEKLEIALRESNAAKSSEDSLAFSARAVSVKAVMDWPSISAASSARLLMAVPTRQLRRVYEV